jgi:hypothetical protein
MQLGQRDLLTQANIVARKPEKKHTLTKVGIDVGCSCGPGFCTYLSIGLHTTTILFTFSRIRSK